jgi:hypothetical protein
VIARIDLMRAAIHVGHLLHGRHVHRRHGGCTGGLGDEGAPAAAGSITTDSAIRSARMVRPMRMDQSDARIAGSATARQMTILRAAMSFLTSGDVGRSFVWFTPSRRIRWPSLIPG